MSTTHHLIDFGESLRWEPSDGVSQFLRMGEADRGQRRL